MKLQLTFQDMAMLKAVLDCTAFTRTDLARIIYKTYKEAMEKYVISRNALIATYEVEEEVDELQADGKTKVKVKKKQVPKEKYGEIEKIINDMKIDLEFESVVYLPLKMAINNFPNIAIDPDTKEKGLKGEVDIEAYEQLKEKFT